MKGSLLKCMQFGQIVDVIYISQNGQITKRRLKVLRLQGEAFQAFCFLRKMKRTFKIENVLALHPVVRKENEVV